MKSSITLLLLLCSALVCGTAAAAESGLDHKSANDRPVDVGLRSQGHVLKRSGGLGLDDVGGILIKACGKAHQVIQMIGARRNPTPPAQAEAPTLSGTPCLRCSAGDSSM